MARDHLTTNRLQADAAYENAHLVAQDLLQRVQELIVDMPAPGVDEHPIDWGHVGSLSEVNQKLSEIISILGGNR